MYKILRRKYKIIQIRVKEALFTFHYRDLTIKIHLRINMTAREKSHSTYLQILE
jgi:hypothetical protein